ncbi:MAG TPA: ABC transporter permease [Bacteroidia bacterium]|nr:ABC transporter permease [Bacteroidia bacterium]
MLNILGLAIGMAVFLLIAQYVKFERSYENFIPGKENIYRVKLESYNNKELLTASAENYPGVGPALKSELPEVMAYARLYNMGYKNNIIITYKDAKPQPVAFKHRSFLYADLALFSMMGYEMVKGDPATALSEPLHAVISEKYAHMYFKDEDPIGKTLFLQDDDFVNEQAKVTGIFKDLPSNTHLKFDILFSYKTLLLRGEWAQRRYASGWGRKDMYTYIQLRPGTDPKKVEAKLPAIVNKYRPEFAGTLRKDVLSLQPLTDIHLYSDLAEEPESNGNGRIVLFMGIIGIFVLVIAWINYVNLSTARALERAKEVGIRKVIGAFKRQLITQFLVEASLVNLFSIIIAWGLAMLSLSYFNTLSGLMLGIGFLFQPWFLVLLLVLWIAGTILSGFYPALVLSSFKPVTVLKGKLKNSFRGILLRKGLVTIQFIASIILIAGTLIVYRQLKFMMSGDLGMNIDQVLIIDRPGIIDSSRAKFNASIDLFRNELKKNPSIEAATFSLTVPGKLREFKVMAKRYSSETNDSAVVRINSMDYNFLDVYKIKLLAGRNFSSEYTKDPDTSIIISKSASMLLGFKTPGEAVGKNLSITQFGWNPVITGVVNDYHQVSLKKTMDPTMFYCAPYMGEIYSLRIRTDNLPQTLDHIQQSWATAFPGNPFSYSFLDEYFNRQYENEKKFGKLFTSFAALAIIIGCLGLFGLAAYTASQRIKEIGIRKVLGASVMDITTMLSKDFLKLVGVAVIIATPVTWFAMNKWLEDFAYRTHITWWIFGIAGILTLLVAMGTVSFQAIKAAVANPVKSLRTE